MGTVQPNALDIRNARATGLLRAFPRESGHLHEVPPMLRARIPSFLQPPALNSLLLQKEFTSGATHRRA